LALTASLLFSVYLLMGRVVRQKTSWLAYVFPLYTVAALTVLTIALVQGVPILGFKPEFYLLCAAMALGPQVLGHGSFNYAIRYLPAAVLGLLSLVEPVGASVLAYFIFQEVPSMPALAGMVIVLGAISVAIVNRKRPTVPASD
ncbi:MAG: DMT family transporter, partial [Rhodothermales bacterium]